VFLLFIYSNELYNENLLHDLIYYEALLQDCIHYETLLQDFIYYEALLQDFIPFCCPRSFQLLTTFLVSVVLLKTNQSHGTKEGCGLMH